MTTSIKKARQAIGETSDKYTDLQLGKIIDIFTVLSDLAIDSYIAKRSKSNEKVYEKNVFT